MLAHSKNICIFVRSIMKLMKKDSFIHKTFDLYCDGFRQMTLGKTLWIIIGIKLFIIFVVLKLFFFPNFLSHHAEKGQEAAFVAGELEERAATGLQPGRTEFGEEN